MDVFSKSDPVVRVFEWHEVTKNWVRIGLTERIDNNLNPDFTKSIQTVYNFERHQKMKFEVVDDDGNNSFDEIGTIETTLGNIMGSKAQTFTADLVGNGKPGSLGSIIVRAESLKSSNIWSYFRI
jgi:hypothetical protein